MTPKEKWNEQFAANPFTYGKEANAFIEAQSNLFATQSKIACFAEGEGRNAVFLAKQGHDVTAFDISPVGLNHTKQLAREEGVTVQTIEADLTEDLTEKEQYHGAVLVFGHVHKDKQQTLIHNLFAAVKKGSYVLFEVYSEEQLKYDSGGPGRREFLYSPIDILQWIAPHDCIHFYYGEVERNEGYRHNGIGHVIQVIARKA